MLLVADVAPKVYPQETDSTRSMNIAEITQHYDNDGQRITQPGKFEGEPVFAPHFWDLAMVGGSDSDNGTVFTFRIKASDPEHAMFPTLKEWLGKSRTLRMREDSQGFVHCF